MWRCRWAGVLPWAPAHTCFTSTGCVSSLWPPGSVTVCGCFLGGSSSKGSTGGGCRGRISPTCCVSSMLLCHPFNLYCSSTGSISHIARTLVLLRLGSSLCLQTKTERNSYSNCCGKISLGKITESMMWWIRFFTSCSIESSPVKGVLSWLSEQLALNVMKCNKGTSWQCRFSQACATFSCWALPKIKSQVYVPHNNLWCVITAPLVLPPNHLCGKMTLQSVDCQRTADKSLTSPELIQWVLII